MHMDVDAARCRDHAFGIAHRGGCSNDQISMHTVHRGRIAGLSDPDDFSILDADVALDDAEHRVDHQRIAQQHIECAHGAVVAWRHPEAVTQRLAAAVQAFLARNGEVMLDLCEQRGIPKANRIARRRPIHMRINFAAHPCHGFKLP